MEELLHDLCRVLCHRMPERSFHGGGVQSLLCIRCTTLWLGCALGFFLSLCPRDPAAFYRRAAFWAAVLIFVPFLDVAAAELWGGSGYNELRYLTGLASGLGMGYVVSLPFLRIFPGFQPDPLHASARQRTGAAGSAGVSVLLLLPFLPLGPLVWVYSVAALLGLWFEAAMITAVAVNTLARWIHLAVPSTVVLLVSIALGPLEALGLSLLPGKLRDISTLFSSLS